MQVLSKHEMYRLYEAGAFGNKLKSWPSLEDYFDDHYSGLVVLRYKGSVGGAWIEYDIERAQVCSVITRWVAEGANPGLITVNQSAPNELLLLQGEVMRSPSYIELRYTTVKLPMRAGLLKEQQNASGTRALSLLKSKLDPSSYEDLWILLDNYEDAVIEFSTWDTNIGSIPGRNTVFWEVRNY